MSISVLESLLVGVFGISVVFAVLVGLSLLLRLQSALVGRFSKKNPAAAVVHETPAAPPPVITPPVAPPPAAPPAVQEDDTDPFAERARQYFVKVNDSVFEIKVGKSEQQMQRDAAETPQIKLAQEPSEATLPIRQAAPVKKAAPQQTAPVPAPAPAVKPNDGGDGIVQSPVPGIVTDIKVTVGATVRRGQVLLLLEAMKMENDITAPRDGTVTQILTSKGASVVTGTPLVKIQ